MIDRRRFQRFFVPFLARREGLDGKPTLFLVKEISVTGCFAVWNEKVEIGEMIRFELPLPNGNCFPVNAKVIYRILEGVGVKFVEISLFEQKLIAEIICYHLKQSNLPEADPFEEFQIGEV